MAVRDDFTAGEVLAAADLNDTFGAKLNLAGGKVLQVVRATDTTERTTTSTSFVDASISVTITPQKSTSEILVISTAWLITFWSTLDEGRGQLQITDNSNNALSGAQSVSFGTSNITGTSTRQTNTSAVLIGRSTPATLSAVTYKLRFKSESANTSTRLAATTNTTQLYAIEVSA
jgi:hypothetical protein